MRRTLAIFVAAQVLVPALVLAEADPATTLWFDQPAKNWNEALPVGNGRLGAMVFGGVATERIQLNEESLWAGQPGRGLARGFPETPGGSPPPGLRRQKRRGGGLRAEASNRHAHLVPLLRTARRSVAGFRQGRKPTPAYRRELQLADGIARVTLPLGRCHHHPRGIRLRAGRRDGRPGDDRPTRHARFQGQPDKTAQRQNHRGPRRPDPAARWPDRRRREKGRRLRRQPRRLRPRRRAHEVRRPPAGPGGPRRSQPPMAANSTSPAPPKPC